MKEVGVVKEKNGFYDGYKGKGMCSHCIMGNKSNPKDWRYCAYYQSDCKLVSRNCPGIRGLK